MSKPEITAALHPTISLILAIGSLGTKCHRCETSMSTQVQLKPDRAASSQETLDGIHDLRELLSLATRGLTQMLDPATGLFCHRLVATKNGLQREGISHRYTVMTLLGLHRLESTGGRSPAAIRAMMDALLQDTTWISTTGDLGLLLWACAEIAPDRLRDTYNNIRASEALTRFADGRSGFAMEVAWYLTGLATCQLAGFAELQHLERQIAAARSILESNCGAFGVYGHVGRSGVGTGYLRGRMGSFADQVYPTIAFSRLADAAGDATARQYALRTAETMCRLQGRHGEWSWQYSVRSGQVISRYPVYAVHQHAMAPMMLFEAGAATGHDFSGAIYKGLAWIRGDNELQRNMIEPSHGLVWRCFYLDRIDNYSDSAVRVLMPGKDSSGSKRVRIRYECRPYELGWLLYAFAGRC